MRRSVLIAVLAGALLGLAVSRGHQPGRRRILLERLGSAAAPEKGSFVSAYTAKQGKRAHGNRRGGGGHGHRGGHGMRFGPLAIAFKGFADRLDVSPRALREAVKGVKKRALDRAVSDGTITQAERDALEACFKSRGKGSGCDRAKARAAHRKLHKAFKQRARTDAAGLKAQLIDDLAAELGKQPGDVESAARATLSAMLDKGVAFGFVTERGRELALACWDKPNECDRAALRAEIRKHFRGHGRHGGGRRGHHP